ncbi:MAG: GlsB/YeaQ/YmgE family stress response membrane protein [Solirubrobacterales bacterium]
MIGEIIGVVLLGIVAGYIGKALMPGKDPGGFLITIVIGIAGALIGYFLFTELLGIGDDDKFDFGGILGAIIGVMILLGLYRVIAKPDARETVAPAAPRARREGRRKPR